MREAEIGFYCSFRPRIPTPIVCLPGLKRKKAIVSLNNNRHYKINNNRRSRPEGVLRRKDDRGGLNTLLDNWDWDLFRPVLSNAE